MIKEETKAFYKDLFKVLAVSLILAGIIRWFIFMPFKVQGASMEENFHNNDYLIVDKISPNFKDWKRGEVVVFKYKGDWRTYYIKRIIGLPGEEVKINNGKIFINGELLEEDYTPGDLDMILGYDEYFVLGDNRVASSDSRAWGALAEKDIIGRVVLRLLPLSKINIF